jgi:hypothetical protein
VITINDGGMGRKETRRNRGLDGQDGGDCYKIVRGRRRRRSVGVVKKG